MYVRYYKSSAIRPNNPQSTHQPRYFNSKLLVTVLFLVLQPTQMSVDP